MQMTYQQVFHGRPSVMRPYKRHDIVDVNEVPDITKGLITRGYSDSDIKNIRR